MTRPPAVYDRDSAERFIRWCVAEIGLGYHPDTAFAEYIEPDGSPAFMPSEAAALDELTAKAFELIDPYEIGAAEFEHIIAGIST